MKFRKESVVTETPPPARLLLTAKDAATLCGIGERTLWRWSRSGIAPAPVKIGGTAIRYRRNEYLAWIDAGCPRCDGRAR